LAFSIAGRSYEDYIRGHPGPDPQVAVGRLVARSGFDMAYEIRGVDPSAALVVCRRNSPPALVQHRRYISERAVEKAALPKGAKTQCP
jgi:hypothetical protein